MACSFINFMSLSIHVSQELKNPILETLLSDYAKERAKNKMHFFLIHLLVKSHKKKISTENKLVYFFIKKYLTTHSVSITKQLLYA